MESAKEIFENLGYKYELINNKDINCEDVILYTQRIYEVTIQFNLSSQKVCVQTENKFKEYDKVVLFITKEVIRAINKQIEELGWE